MNTGKIARLPHIIREQLNLRLLDNEPAEPILEWLNGQPPVQKVLLDCFGSKPITKQNLSEWRTGAFAVWSLRQEVAGGVRHTDETVDAIKQVSDRRLADSLATVLAGRYAVLISTWDGTVSEVFNQQGRALSGLCHDITQLRKGDHSAIRTALAEEKQAAARGKTDAELKVIFQKWLRNDVVRQWVQADYAAEDARAAKCAASSAFPRPPLPPGQADVPPPLHTIAAARKQAAKSPEPLRDYPDPNEAGGSDDREPPADFGPETLDLGHTSPVAPSPTQSTPEPVQPAQPVDSQAAPSDPIQPNPGQPSEAPADLGPETLDPGQSSPVADEDVHPVPAAPPSEPVAPKPAEPALDAMQLYYRDKARRAKLAAEQADYYPRPDPWVRRRRSRVIEG